MVHVLSRRWRSRWSWVGLFLGLAAVLLLIVPSPAPGQSPAAKSPQTSKSDQDAGRAKAAPADEAGEQEAPAVAPDVPGAPVADPSKTRRVAPVEIFKDENVEDILDLKKLTQLPGTPPTQNDFLRVLELAKNPNLPADRAMIDRFVRGLAAQLTDRNSVRSLLEDPEENEAEEKGAPAKKAAAAAKGDAGRTIQVATSYLLDPIFAAEGAHNESFLREYRRSLHTFLPPLLKNHLVPRVQAMIVLGEAANPTPEGLKLFENEIASKSQALWVKLWALEGICNIKKKAGGRFSTSDESRVGRVIAEFLTDKSLPWPIQMRGVQALGWLRQGALPTESAKAPMANAAMSFLADPETKLEVRAEAARALGLMQTAAISRYNYKLVAAAAGQLVADLASEINDLYSDNPPRAENPTRATYLAALLVGPAYQTFEGVEGQSGSGLLRTASADSDSMKYTQKVFSLIKPIAQAAINLRGAPSKEFKKRKQDLAGSIAALRSFLRDNPPSSRRLVPGGPQFGGDGQAAGAGHLAPAQPVVQARRGR